MPRGGPPSFLCSAVGTYCDSGYSVGSPSGKRPCRSVLESTRSFGRSLPLLAASRHYGPAAMCTIRDIHANREGLHLVCRHLPFPTGLAETIEYVRIILRSHPGRARTRNFAEKYR